MTPGMGKIVVSSKVIRKFKRSLGLGRGGEILSSVLLDLRPQSHKNTFGQDNLAMGIMGEYGDGTQEMQI